MRRMTLALVLCLGVLSLSLRPAVSDEPGGGSSFDAQFHRAYYLQTHQHDPAAAATVYEKLAGDAAAPEALRKEAKTRLAEVREDLATVDFSRIMPSDVLGYAEIVEPGEHIAAILKMMGLLGSNQPIAGDQKPVSLGNGLQLPADFAVSPALIAELKSFRGLAAGLTSLDDHGKPSGLVAIHPGDCNLMRGAIETLVQLLEQGEPIEGFKTYRLPEQGWITLTARLVLVADSRDQLSAAVGRLKHPSDDSLATRKEFKRAHDEAGRALVFVFVDGPQIVKRFGPMWRGQEAAIARGMLDLEHLESLVLTLTTSETGIRQVTQLNLMPGHHNMVYALVRTAPITKRSLAHVPRGAAGVFVLGLNPPGGAVPAEATTPGSPSLSAMDIGREFFNNIEELSVFVMPPATSVAGQPLPELGVVISVKDPAKSEALWNQILTLAAMFGAHAAEAPSDAIVEGKTGRLYHFAGAPAIAVVRSDRELVIGTQEAVTAAVRAGNTKDSIAQDAAFASLLAKLSPDTSKAVLVDVGRAVEVASALSQGSAAQELKRIAAVVRDLKVSVVTDEAPNRLTIRCEVTGLPKLPAILSLIEQEQQQHRRTAKQ